MHLADLDENGTIDKDELAHSTKASSLLEGFYYKVDREFLTRSDIVDLIPELKVLETLVEEMSTCLSNAPSYDPFLINIKIRPVSFFFLQPNWRNNSPIMKTKKTIFPNVFSQNYFLQKYFLPFF